MAYEIRWEKSCAHIIYSKTVSMDTIIKCEQEMFTNPKFNFLEYIIADFSNVEVFDTPENSIKQSAHHTYSTSYWNKKVNLSIIISPENQYLADLYVEQLNRIGFNWPIKIFNNISDARKWIESNK